MKTTSSIIIIFSLIIINNTIQAQKLQRFEGVDIYALGKDTIEYPLDGNNPVGHLLLYNDSQVNSPSGMQISVVCSAVKGGKLNVFPNMSRIAVLKAGDSSYINNWFLELFQNPVTPFKEGEFRQIKVEYQFSTPFNSAVASRNYIIYYAGSKPVLYNKVPIRGKVVFPTPSNIKSIYIQKSTLNGALVNVNCTLSVSDTGYIFTDTISQRNDWYFHISGNVKSMSYKLNPNNGNDIRITVDTQEIICEYKYDTISCIQTTTGFWRGAASESEQTLVFFPGQENWMGGVDSNLKAQSKIYKYTFSGNKVWEHAPGWETWGGDMSQDGKYVAYCLYNGKYGNVAYNDSIRLTLLDGTTGMKIWSKTNSKDYESYEVKFSNDGKYIALGTIGTGRVLLIERSSGNTVWKIPSAGMIENADGFGQVRKIIFDKNDSFIYAGSGDNFLRKIKVSDGTVIWRSCVGGWPFVNGLEISSDGNFLIVGMKSAMVACVRTSDGKINWIHDTGNFDDAGFSPDGNYVTTFSGKNFNAKTGELVGRSGNNSVGRFTSDSRYICRIYDRIELYNADGSNKAYTSVRGNMGLSKGEQPQWMYLSKNDKYAVVASRDMNNSPQTGLIFFKKTESLPNSITNIKSKKTLPINCFPNPAESITNICFELNENKVNLKIYDILGKVVYVQENLINDCTPVSMAAFQSGVYTVMIEKNGVPIQSTKLAVVR